VAAIRVKNNKQLKNKNKTPMWKKQKKTTSNITTKTQKNKKNQHSKK